MLKTQLMQIVGPEYLVPDDQLAPWSQDWSGLYHYTPLAVVRPANAAQVSQILRLANATGTTVVPIAGNTGLAGGAEAEGAILLSLDRMNKIREIRPKAGLAIVEAGVILSALHDAAAVHDLIFPLTFGARGSAMIGGNLSTKTTRLRHGYGGGANTA
jgi:FAD/FMN-containing dehydrogenase